MKLKEKLQLLYLNNASTRIDRKVLVIESDDWGTIRMPSEATYEALKNKGFPVGKCAYNRFDSLESNEDIEALLETLHSVRDSQGNPAVITANWIAANPDFEKIEKSDYSTYSFESSIQTLQSYQNSDQVYALQKEGMARKVFFPQFHGREHVHVYNWMRMLKDKESDIREAFRHRMISFNSLEIPGCESDVMDAYNAVNREDLMMSTESITEGLKMFEAAWGFQSKTAIAPCYFWHPKHEKVYADNGVDLLQGNLVQKIPLLQNAKWKKKYRRTGMRNSLGQYYSVRNVFFEPSIHSDGDIEGRCLQRIQHAFDRGRPAIVSAHRLNFIGRIVPMNRKKNLDAMRSLLQKVIQLWPDVEFMHSAHLLQVLTDKNGLESKSSK